jgi:hypothetical protein
MTNSPSRKTTSEKAGASKAQAPSVQPSPDPDAGPLPPYPGFARPEITQIRQAKTSEGSTELTIHVRWDHGAAPRTGLPTWVQIRVTSSDGESVFDLTSDPFVVPERFDLDAREAVLKRTITFDAPGTYTVVVDAGHPEMLPTLPKEIQVT